jgi:hypothetical protein
LFTGVNMKNNLRKFCHARFEYKSPTYVICDILLHVFSKIQKLLLDYYYFIKECYVCVQVVYMFNCVNHAFQQVLLEITVP